jgi:CII-binding regulator of phage lambda lysogenization HflD
MEKTDLLNDLMSADPSGPASNGVVLLLRAETKHGFKALESKMDSRFEKVDRSLELLAQQVLKHDQRFDDVDAKFSGIDQRLDRIEQQLSKILEMERQLARLTKMEQQLAILIARP